VVRGSPVLVELWQLSLPQRCGGEWRVTVETDEEAISAEIGVWAQVPAPKLVG
jgi:hypothetical protein